MVHAWQEFVVNHTTASDSQTFKLTQAPCFKSKKQPLLACVFGAGDLLFGIPCSASLVAKFISGFYSLHPPGPKRATKLPSCEPQHTHTHEVASPGRTKYSTISEKLMFVSISCPNYGSKSSFAQQLVPQLGVDRGVKSDEA